VKVYDLVQQGHLGTTAAKDARQAPKAQGQARREAGAADRVELSDLADQMRAAAVVESAHHEARIAELRALIEAGRYDVSPEDVAEAILREELLPWIVK